MITKCSKSDLIDRIEDCVSACGLKPFVDDDEFITVLHDVTSVGESGDCKEDRYGWKVEFDLSGYEGPGNGRILCMVNFMVDAYEHRWIEVEHMPQEFHEVVFSSIAGFLEEIALDLPSDDLLRDVYSGRSVDITDTLLSSESRRLKKLIDRSGDVSANDNSLRL